MRRHEQVTTDRPGSDGLGYLRERVRPTALVVLLMLAMAYPFAASAEQSALFLALCGLGALLAVRAPRWVCYVAMAVALLVLVSEYVFVISTGPQDSQSDRNEAVELAAQAFLAGTNPWARPTQLGTPISTGPASVLVALPAVLVTHKINTMSFAFYMMLFALLLAADLRHRNETFLPLGLFFTSGFLGFQHAMYWSLDELAWAYLALALGWRLLDQGWPMGAGACMAFALCSRASYGFPVFAFLCWWAYGTNPRRDLVRIAAGAALGALLMITPFFLIGGRDLLTHNPLTVTEHKLTAPWPDTNPIFRALNVTVGALGQGPAGLAKIAFALAVIWYLAKRLGSASPPHPFWHMCFAAFMASFLVYPAHLADDYTLFFAVPALLAVALSPHGFGAAAAAFDVALATTTAHRRRSPR